MRARKVDKTQREIIDALRRVGCLVWHINGALDLAVQFRGQVVLLEAKSKGGKLTAAQHRMRDQGWKFHVVVTVQDAYDAVGIPARMQL